MFRILIDNQDGSPAVDYARYVAPSSIVVQDKLNQPSTIQMVLRNIDDAFVTPVREAYVRIYSTRFGRVLATGFVAQIPTQTFTGLNHNTPSTAWQSFDYAITVQSDDYLLNAKASEFFPAEVGLGDGQIMAVLANRLAPGFFDCTSDSVTGDLIPYFAYDPSKNWGQYAKQFADAARYRVGIRNKRMFFAPYGDQPLGIAYDESRPQKTFKTSGLNTALMNTQLANDCIVIGAEEPGNNHDDYFCGDGFTGNFGLRHLLFEGTSTDLINEPWTGSAIDSKLWAVVDPTDAFFMAGTLNVVGGPGQYVSGSDVWGSSYILSNSAIELGGKLVIEHGEVVPIDSTRALIGGLYEKTSSRMPTVNLLNFGDNFTEASWSVSGGSVSGSNIVTFDHASSVVEQVVGPLATYAETFTISFSASSLSPPTPELQVSVVDIETGAEVINSVAVLHSDVSFFSFSGQFPFGLGSAVPIPGDHLRVRFSNRGSSSITVDIQNTQLEYGGESTPYVDTQDEANWAMTDVFLPYEGCIAGFDLRDGPSGVIPSVSGAEGVAIQPVFNGALVAGVPVLAMDVSQVQVFSGTNSQVEVTLGANCPFIVGQWITFEELEGYTRLNGRSYQLTSTDGPTGPHFWFYLGYSAPAYGPTVDTGSVSALGANFPLLTKINHNYTLRTIVSCYNQSRYDTVYRTLAGTPYGGNNTVALADITWVIDDLDLTYPWANPVEYRLTIKKVPVPSFVRYAPINNYDGNMTLSYTSAYFPPQGSAQVQSFYKFVNAASQAPLAGFPWPPSYDMVASLPLLDYEMGFGIYGAKASIQSAQQGADSSQLAFYSNNLPSLGSRIRFQSWEAQAAVARVQSIASITAQAAIVGDDGDRMTVFTDFNPPPRTSEECELAGAQAIADRVDPTYQGSYTLEHTFFDFLNYDYPRSGRLLNINAPERDIVYRDFIVNEVQFTITELFEEQMMVQLTFSPSKYLPTLLQQFLPTPVGVLTATDTLNPPTPIELAQIGLAFAPDLDNLRLEAPWDVSAAGFDGSRIYVAINDPTINAIEVRRTNNGWGTNNRDLIGRFTTQNFTLPRLTFEQSWYMRAIKLGVPSYGIDSLGFGYLPHGNYYLVTTSVINGVEGPPFLELPIALTVGNAIDLGFLTSTTRAYLTAGLPGSERFYTEFSAGHAYITIFPTTPGTPPLPPMSRRAKVVRVYAPLIPQPPILDPTQPVNPDNYTVPDQIKFWFAFNGDIRNIYGIEIRGADDRTVLLRQPVVSPYDLIWTYSLQTAGTLAGSEM